MLVTVAALFAVSAFAADTNFTGVSGSPVIPVTTLSPLLSGGVIYSSGTSTLVGSNQVVLATNTPIVSVPYSRNVTLSFKGNLTGAGTDPVIVYFNRGDGVIWVTNAIALSLTPAGTVPQSVATNIDMGGFTQLQLNTATNTGANTVIFSNFTFSTSFKRGL